MKPPTKKENEIIELFHSLNDNSSNIISKIVNLPVQSIDYILNKFIAKKTKYKKEFNIYQSKMNYETNRKM